MKNWISSKQDILDCPLPAQTASYSVIPHKVFLEEIAAELRSKGYTIAEERYLTLSNCQVLTGMYRIMSSIDSDMAPAISFVNSYNKTRKAEIRASALVLVCKNGMIGTVDNGAYTRKHTGDALEQFREHIKMVIAGLEDEFKRLILNREEMRKITLTNELRATLIGDMYINEGMINSAQLSILKSELKKSLYFRGDTLWDFYNNCTEALKDNHPSFFDKQHIKLHTYVCDKFNLTGSRGLYNTLPAYKALQNGLDNIGFTSQPS